MTPYARLGLAGLILVLAGCSGFANTLGFGRNAPDEFAVVDRPPLSMPPEFDLKPPKPGAARPQEVPMQDKAKTTLLGERSTPSGEATDIEQETLNFAQASKADPSIRTTIDKEAAERVVGTEHLVEELLWWHDDEGKGATVDAAAEAARIKAAKEKGENPAKGATPIIERDKSGWLGI